MTSDDDRREAQGPPDYDAIQREIRDRQARIGDTLDSLRHRLAPGNLKEQTMNRMTNRMSSGASSMGDMVRGNPVPLALIGLGVGWMLLSRTGMDQRIAHSRAVGSVRDGASSTARYARDTFYSATDTVRHAAEDLYNRAGDAVGSASDRMSDATNRMGGRDDVYRDGRSMPSTSRGGGGAGGMTRRMSSVSSSFWDLVDDHPLVAGVMGVAVGAAIGASIPSTRYEERWVGDYAHQVTDRAKEMAQDAIDRGTRAARAAADSAREHLAEAASDAQDAAKDEINRGS